MKHSNFTFWHLRYFVKCVFLTMGSSNAEGLLQIYLHLADTYKKRFMSPNGQEAVLKCSAIWKKRRKRFKTSELKAQVHSTPGNGKLWLYQLEKEPYSQIGKISKLLLILILTHGTVIFSYFRLWCFCERYSRDHSRTWNPCTWHDLLLSLFPSFTKRIRFGQSDMVKHELRVTSCELQVESLKARIESLKPRVQIQKCEFKSASYEFKYTCYQFKFTSYKFKSTS